MGKAKRWTQLRGSVVHHNLALLEAGSQGQFLTILSLAWSNFQLKQAEFLRGKETLGN